MATLKDIAKESGFTAGTVSRVLNNRGYISDHTRQKVEEAAKRLNYHTNEAVRTVQNKKPDTIGLIVPHVYHPYMGKMISHLEAQARRKGYQVLLFNTQCTYEKEEECIRLCCSSKVAGMIICSGSVALDVFERIDIPVVTMERFLDNGTASVECDNKQGGVLAAEKLAACGCSHLLHVGNIGILSMPADLRLEGFREVCKREKIPYEELLMEDKDFYDMKHYEMLEQALQKYPQTDGIFANSDVIAAQALQVCQKLQIKVPQQMKIIGFDDVRIASLTTPQLTSIRQPVREMAEAAVNLLHDAISGKLVARRTVMPVSLVEREST